MTRALRLQLALGLVLALAIRVAVVLATPRYVPNTDAADFDRNALSLAVSGHLPVASVLTLQGGPTAFRPPAFSLLLSLSYRVTGTADAAGRWEGARLLQAGLGTLTVLFVFWLGWRVGGPRLARIAGALAAIYPPFILLGTSLLSESLFLPALLAAVIAALEARRRLGDHRRRVGLTLCAAAGVLTALAALSRSNGIIIVIALVGLVWVPRLWGGGQGRAGEPVRRRSALLAPAVLLLATALALVPWTIRNADVFHQFVPTTTESGYVLAGVYNPAVQSGAGPRPGFWYPPVAAMLAIQRKDPRIDEAQMDDRLTHEAISYIDAHPLSLIRESGWTLGRLLGTGGPGFTRWIARLEAYPPTLAVISLYAFWVVGALAGVELLLRTAAGLRRRTRFREGRAEATVGLDGGGRALWLCPLLLILSTVAVIGDARYRVPADPFVLLLTAAGLLRVTRRLPRTGEPPGVTI